MLFLVAFIYIKTNKNLPKTSPVQQRILQNFLKTPSTMTLTCEFGTENNEIVPTQGTATEGFLYIWKDAEFQTPTGVCAILVSEIKTGLIICASLIALSRL